MDARLIRNQKKAGHRWLRFVPELEVAFQRHRLHTMRQRAGPVAISALVLYCFYSLFDPLMFPSDLALQTVAVRLLLTCPVAVLLLWLRHRLSARPFVALYSFSYLWGGFGVVLIIGLARIQHVDMPYDGIFLVLMYGYLIMGLPVRLAAACSSVLLLAYLAMEILVQTPEPLWLRNGFFALTAHVLGMVGGWLQEHNQRSHFLDRCLLDIARREAEADSEQTSRFIAVASHDLRQPLHIINLLLSQLETASPSGRRAILRQLNQTVDHTNGLLGSLLDISRLRQGMVNSEPEAIPVDELFSRLLAESASHPCYANMEVSCHVEPDLHVWADPVLLGRCLRNLLNNALEHSGATHFHCSARIVSDTVSMVLEDNGVGIELSQQSRVFDAFYQQGSGQGLGSLGLGLAIVRQLARLMGGDCLLASAPGRGCRFTLMLPVARVAPSSQRPEAALKSASGCVLLVEEHAETRQLQQEALCGWGYQVITAERLEQARVILATLSIDLVMTDLHLPDGEGLALVEELRAAGRSIPVVVLTADTSLRQQHDRSRAVWVLHKPLPPARLRVVLDRLFRADQPETPVIPVN